MSSTTHTMGAGTASGTIGYDNATGVSFGSMSPTATGSYVIRGLVWTGVSINTLILYMSQSGTPTDYPPDNDTVFEHLDITGVFTDSGGSSVTRSVTRASRNFLGGANMIRQWRWNTPTIKFISGNNYTVTLVRTDAAPPPAKGIHVRLASGITPVKDWYIRTSSGIQKVKAAYIRTASGIKQYWSGQPAQTDHVMVAGVDSPEPNKGYNAFPVYGSMTPFNSGTFNWQALVTFNASASLTVLWADAASTAIVENTDATFQKIQITGVFSDSGGSSVMWELLRSDGGYSGFGFQAQWNYTTSRKFITGNSYAVRVLRT